MDRTSEVDSPYAWLRLAICVLISTIGGVGMWSVVVALPAVQAEFGAGRGAASLPYTAVMIGIAVGGVYMGRLADRFGILVPILIGTLCLGAGYVAAAFSADLLQFAAIQAVLVAALGSSATFSPLIADVSRWFVRRRGTAVAICAVGNYLAGAIWPPILQRFIDSAGWRATHVGIGLFCLATIPLLAIFLRRPPPVERVSERHERRSTAGGTLGLPPNGLQGAVMLAGVACCVAMSMPQVHMVAYCGDLGYGAARGAEMLSLMFAFGILSRLASGWIADRIGGLRTLLLGSVLQGVALLLYLAFDGLASLYVVSALFGLFQGGIVPSYAIIVREQFSPREAGTRVGLVLMATLFGMALGGWLSGAIFDWAGSYRSAFLNGVLWNLFNVAVVTWLLLRPGTRLAPA